MKFWSTNIILLLIGMGSCTGSFYLGKSSITKLLNWETAQGQVIGHTTRTNKSYNGLIVSFPYEGKNYEFKSSLSSETMPRNFRVTVLLPKGDPSQAEARHYGFLLGLPFGLWFLGFVMSGIGYISIKRRIKGEPDPDPSQLKPNPELDGVRDFLKENVRKF